MIEVNRDVYMTEKLRNEVDFASLQESDGHICSDGKIFAILRKYLTLQKLVVLVMQVELASCA